MTILSKNNREHKIFLMIQMFFDIFCNAFDNEALEILKKEQESLEGRKC